MKVRRAYRERRPSEVAVLDALVDRGAEGMTVLELRAAVDADIDTIEEALSSLKEDDLIVVNAGDGSTIITPEDRVILRQPDEPEHHSLLERLRQRFGL